MAGLSELDNDFSLVMGTLSGRGGIWFGGIVGIEGILGVGFIDSEIKVGAGALDVSREKTSWDLLAGAQATLRPLPWLDVYARYTGLGGVDFDDGDSGVESYELGVSVGLTKQYGLALMTGWRHWEVEETQTGESSIETELSDPFVGLQVGF